MRGHRDFLGGLSELGKIRDEDERRAVWRQSMATLASAVVDQRPVPLEGLDPDGLRESVQRAIATNLIGDLDFLSPAAAAAALYELAASLPVGTEKRELGRRVLKMLLDGDAPTFVALATQIALGSRRALSGTPIRARVALALDLPLGAGARADGLALALISRKDVEREWLTLPSTGSLPSRRLSARLLERAAREAARRAAQGDDSGVRVFSMESVRAAWQRLLANRESLVWRHVASARGLLSEAVLDLGAEIENELDPKLTPTEWRRGAASLAARIAVAPQAARARAHALLESDVFRQDGGIAAAMIMGLPRVIDAEPDVAEELLTILVKKGGLDAAEALVDLRRERVGGDVGTWASELARAELREVLARGSDDDGRIALIEALHADLAPGEDGESNTLPERIARALVTFAEKGPRAAYAEAYEILEAADGALGTLALSRDDEPSGRRHVFRALRELDAALLEKDTLRDLLMLGASPDGKTPATEVLDDIFARLSAWLVAREGETVEKPGAVAHLTHRIRRMRTLLHLVDADEDIGDERSGARREQSTHAAAVLLKRVTEDARTPLRRITCAAAARACDALVREDICEVSDVVLAAARAAKDPHDVLTFAEATMVPEIELSLRAYLELGATIEHAPPGGMGERACLDALNRFAHALPVATSPRVEALRGGLLRLGRALEAVATAGSLHEIAEGTDGTLLAALETEAQNLAQLLAGARRRLKGVMPEPPSSGAVIRLLDYGVERAIRGSNDAIWEALRTASETLRFEHLPHVAECVLLIISRIPELPVEAPRRTRVSFVPRNLSEAPLPPWLPPGRVLGGFYVLRGLGTGAGGSVFIARRAEQKSDPNAERFALKVPEYDGTVARTLSEAEFLTLFRQEAGALLSLPRHTNIAEFVTFDAGARPKPILVMELVEGPTLERVLSMKDLDTKRAFELLDGIADGLIAMHGVGIGHLDVKPSNVILRDPDGLAGPLPPDDPVLVDFGLAGRHVRPGCATGEYGAPEVWGAFGHDDALAPMPADVYAFGCVAYEVLTSKTLFEAPTEIALITAHLAHDGRPDGIAELAKQRETAPVADVLSRALRREPEARATIAELQTALRELAPRYERTTWPLAS